MGTKLDDMVHPTYAERIADWQKFRLVAEGGRKFIDAYLKKFSAYESDTDFKERRSITHNPGHATAVLHLIRNALFQSLSDVNRPTDIRSYVEACAGLDGGVDRLGRSMNTFLGECVIKDLCSVEKVGVYVEAPVIPVGVSRVDEKHYRPYLYTVPAEDILNWEYDTGVGNGRFSKLLLRVWRSQRNVLGLPEEIVPIYHYLRTGSHPETGKPIVILQIYYDSDIDKSSPVEQILDIDHIPFHLADLDCSIFQDIADHQISALNLDSSDMNHLWRSNFPIYTEQVDVSHRMREMFNSSRGTAEESEGGAASATTLEGRVTQRLTEPDLSGNVVGNLRGRKYSKGLERPGFVHPSPDPVLASMEKQERIAAEIRQLADLALSSLAAKYASGTSKQEDRKGLEAGLAYIGFVLNRLENSIYATWAFYEGQKATQTVGYPTSYSIQLNSDRLQEATNLCDLSLRIPSQTFRKTVQALAVRVALGSRVSNDLLNQSMREVNESAGSTCDPEVLTSDIENGLVGLETASALRGYSPDEVEKAKKDHAERIARIQQSQSDPAARGVNDLSVDPKAPEKEKKLTQDPDL